MPKLQSTHTVFATSHNVTLLPMKKPFHWFILFHGKKVGKVDIYEAYDNILGNHFAINIHINQSARGKHIGRFALLKACQESQLPVVFAHIRKSNIGSIKAALAAGFKPVKSSRPLTLVWMK